MVFLFVLSAAFGDVGCVNLNKGVQAMGDFFENVAHIIEQARRFVGRMNAAFRNPPHP
jgi:hypothetical protein